MSSHGYELSLKPTLVVRAVKWNLFSALITSVEYQLEVLFRAVKEKWVGRSVECLL